MQEENSGRRIAATNELDLQEILYVVWRAKMPIAGATLLGAVIAVIFALMLPNVYRAEAVLAPNHQEAPGGLSALAGKYGGLASLAGFDLESGGVDKVTLGLEILRSRQFISRFIDDHEIKVPLIAGKSWDPLTEELRINDRLYDITTKSWVREVTPPTTKTPSAQEAYEVFLENLSIGVDKESGLVRVAIEHVSPVLAQQWVNWLVDDLNRVVMQRDVAKAEKAIDYLREQADSTSIAELQGVFYRLIEEQTKTIVLARVSSEYILQTIDPAVAPEKKFRPKRSLIVLLGALLSFIAATLMVFSLDYARERRV